jgi:hypothetical protein
MIGMGYRGHVRHRAAGLGLALLLIGLCGGCMTGIDDGPLAIRPTSNDDQASSQLKQQRGLVGKVTTLPDQSPLSGAVIEAVSLDQPSVAVPERIVMSKEDGRYYWPLRPGHYQLTARAACYLPRTVRVQVGEASLDVKDFTLERAR